MKKEKDKKLAEFHYKILTDNLVTANQITHWNADISENCVPCNVKDDTEHILFNCTPIKEIWKIIENTLEITFEAKKLLLSDYGEGINETLNTIVYTLYKFWLETTNKRANKTVHEAKQFVKKNTLCQSKIMRIRNKELTARYLERISDSIV